ncbi:MAG: hypothetical protein CNLJKLNK_00433 [Holosporales bacterium]
MKIITLIFTIFTILTASESTAFYQQGNRESFMKLEEAEQKYLCKIERSDRLTILSQYLQSTYFERIVKVYFPKSHPHQNLMNRLHRTYYMQGYVSYFLDIEHNTSYCFMMAKEIQAINNFQQSNFIIIDIEKSINKHANIFGAYYNIIKREDAWDFCDDGLTFPLIAYHFNRTLFFHASQIEHIPIDTLIWIRRKFRDMLSNSQEIIRIHYHILKKQKKEYVKNREMNNLFKELEQRAQIILQMQMIEKIRSFRIEDALNPQAEIGRCALPEPGETLKIFKIIRQRAQAQVQPQAQPQVQPQEDLYDDSDDLNEENNMAEPSTLRHSLASQKMAFPTFGAAAPDTLEEPEKKDDRDEDGDDFFKFKREDTSTYEDVYEGDLNNLGHLEPFILM